MIKAILSGASILVWAAMKTKSIKSLAIATSAATLILIPSAAIKADIITPPTPSDLGPPTVETFVGIPGATFQDPSNGFLNSQTTLGTVSGSFTSSDGGTGSGQSTTSANQAVSVNLNLVAGSDPVFGIGGKALATLSYVMNIYSPTDQSVQLKVNATGGGHVHNQFVSRARHTIGVHVADRR